MTRDIRKFRILLDTAKSMAKRISWESQGYDHNKSCCLAICSELTYYLVSKDEIRHPDRALIVPSETHGRIVRSREIIGSIEILRQDESLEFVTVETKYNGMD
jgi:hypothetical protein